MVLKHQGECKGCNRGFIPDSVTIVIIQWMFSKTNIQIKSERMKKRERGWNSKGKSRRRASLMTMSNRARRIYWRANNRTGYENFETAVSEEWLTQLSESAVRVNDS